MDVSARNQIKGTIKSVNKGSVMAEIEVILPGGAELVSVITIASADRMQLAVGKEVMVVVKSTDVMLATD